MYIIYSLSIIKYLIEAQRSLIAQNVKLHSTIVP